MKTTLIYNPHSGPGFSPRLEEIMDILRKIGHDPTHTPTESEVDLDRALAEVEDLVVVAGGDGTIRAVAIRLLGRNVKIAPIPMGTANNIAHLLALAGNPLEIVAGLADPIQKALDIGHVQTPDGSAYFLESMGVGAFADVLNKSNPQDGKSISRTIQSMLDTLKDYQPKFFHISAAHASARSGVPGSRYRSPGPGRRHGAGEASPGRAGARNACRGRHRRG
jgi:diacylglycerol kinase family enzyme